MPNRSWMARRSPPCAESSGYPGSPGIRSSTGTVKAGWKPLPTEVADPTGKPTPAELRIEKGASVSVATRTKTSGYPTFRPNKDRTAQEREPRRECGGTPGGGMKEMPRGGPEVAQRDPLAAADGVGIGLPETAPEGTRNRAGRVEQPLIGSLNFGSRPSGTSPCRKADAQQHAAGSRPLGTPIALEVRNPDNASSEARQERSS